MRNKNNKVMVIVFIEQRKSQKKFPNPASWKAKKNLKEKDIHNLKYKKTSQTSRWEAMQYYSTQGRRNQPRWNRAVIG